MNKTTDEVAATNRSGRKSIAKRKSTTAKTSTTKDQQSTSPLQQQEPIDTVPLIKEESIETNSSSSTNTTTTKTSNRRKKDTPVKETVTPLRKSRRSRNSILPSATIIEGSELLNIVKKDQENDENVDVESESIVSGTSNTNLSDESVAVNTQTNNQSDSSSIKSSTASSTRSSTRSNSKKKNLIKEPSILNLVPNLDNNSTSVITKKLDDETNNTKPNEDENSVASTASNENQSIASATSSSSSSKLSADSNDVDIVGNVVNEDQSMNEIQKSSQKIIDSPMPPQQQLNNLKSSIKIDKSSKKSRRKSNARSGSIGNLSLKMSTIKEDDVTLNEETEALEITPKVEQDVIAPQSNETSQDRKQQQNELAESSNIDVLNDNSSSNSNNPPSNDAVLNHDDSSNNNSNNKNDIDEPKKKKRRRSTSLMLMGVGLEQKSGIHITNVSQLFIYNWPLEEQPQPIGSIYDTQSNSYLLQEQFSEYLDIKSFKRKYPDIFRRFIDIKEREHLKENKVVTETQCDLGLTALKLSDCLDILADDYPEKYKEFTNYLNEKRRKSLAAISLNNNTNNNNNNINNNIASKVSSINSGPSGSTVPIKPTRPPLTESERLREQMRKAIKSVSSYNSMLQREKKEERNYFFDLQTMRIQQPRCNAPSNTAVSQSSGQYPVSLIQGQFQHYFKRYSNKELKSLPINTILNAPETPDPYLYEEWKRNEIKSKLTNKNEKNESSDDERVNSAILASKNQPDKYNVISSALMATSSSSNTLPTSITSSNKINSILAQSTSATPTSIRVTASAAPTIAAKTTTINTSTQKLTSIAMKTESKICYVCGKTTLNMHSDSQNNSIMSSMINCSSCTRSSHPICLELNPDIVDWNYIRSYDWQCMECKKCSTCSNPHDEERMMFCDRCDRGFHTYCVDMKEVPSGSWICKTCVTNSSVNRMSSSNSSSNSSMDVKAAILNRKIRSSLDDTPNHNILNYAMANNIASVVTPKSEPRVVVHGRRGRPPGSLNKPKDPNSPRKLAKSNKIKSLDMNSSNMVSGGYDENDEHSNSIFNNQSTNSMDSFQFKQY